MKNCILLFVLFALLKSGIGYSQDVNVKIGFKDNVQSKVLNENRQLIVSLPKGYETSDQTYPVLYCLDGTETGLLEAILITRKLRAEMIIVAIPNTDRDGWNPSYFMNNPGYVDSRG
jgi:enterochelin esterase-like enzyme